MTDAARRVRFLVPDGVDDPERVSGGNVYDRQVRDGLRGLGWEVAVGETSDAAATASLLRAAADGSLMLVDGLVACQAADALEGETARLRIVVLMHMMVAAFPDATPQEMDAERRALTAARRVIATSGWTAGELVRRGYVVPELVAVAPPGVHATDGVTRPRSDRDLLCVGVIAPHKGQDTLVRALGRIPEKDWSCEIVGSGERYPAYAADVADRARALGGRVRITGVLGGDDLAEAYRRSAVLVAPSRVESAGMAIADARARGMPVIAARTGGIPDALADGGGLLVPPGDPDALAGALHAWMTDPDLRTRLRREAAAARAHLPEWRGTVSLIADALEAT